MIRPLLPLLSSLILLNCTSPAPSPVTVASYLPLTTEVDSARLLSDLYFLSSPALAGRATGSPGNAAARAYIEAELRAAGVHPFPSGWTQEFEVRTAGGAPLSAANVIGYLPGTNDPEHFLVLSAHYDHLGVRNGEIYPGADDNASGSAGLLEIARYLAAHPPEHSVIFAAFDAEELGLLGARAFVANPPVPLSSILLNINLDMIGRNEKGELYLAGTHPYPFLDPLVDRIAGRQRLRIMRGHDQPTLPPGEDWTYSSDHGAFHSHGIPFAYFGVEDHPDYHRPSDTFENIDPAFFVEAVRTILDFVEVVDGYSELPGGGANRPGGAANRPMADPHAALPAPARTP